MIGRCSGDREEGDEGVGREVGRAEADVPAAEGAVDRPEERRARVFLSHDDIT